MTTQTDDNNNRTAHTKTGPGDTNYTENKNAKPMNFEISVADLNVMDEADTVVAEIAADIISMLSSSFAVPHGEVVRHIRKHYGPDYLRATSSGGVGVSRAVRELMHKAALIEINWNGRKQCWWTPH